MKEEKTLFQSPANVDTVTEKRQRMERYGWILENSQFDQDRNVTRLFYTRDLSIPENLQKKEWEEEVRDAVLAQRFAENNIAYCEHRKNDTKKPRSHKAVIIIMLVAILVCVGLVYLFRFADILTYGKFETKEELENFKQTFVYQFPDGKTLFGKTEFSYSELINFLTFVLGGLASLFLAVILIMGRSTRKDRLIQTSEYKYLTERQKLFEELSDEASNVIEEFDDIAEITFGEQISQ